jgi:group II intron reverse transcriptase/maturase
MAIAAANDKTRELQRTLYRAARADPQRRFHALYDKVHRRDVLERAWGQVRRNRGAAGIDRKTLADVEHYGIDRLLDELAADLRSGSYRPLPARRVFIPKPGSREQRPLSIPAVRDRVVQVALKTVIEPIFEADFLPCSFGFCPRRSAHDALQVLIDETWRGRRWVVETDIANCFEAISHCDLVSAVEDRICDRRVLKLVRALLRAGVMEDGAVRHSVTGTPQGGVASPLLANVYLHRLDREWQQRGHGVLVRYADDLVAICGTRREAQQALVALRAILAELGLEPKQTKTRIVPARGRRGARLPRLPPSLGAGPQLARQADRIPRPLALTSGDAARPRPRPAAHHAPAAAAPSRASHAGDQHLPARLGGLLPLRKLDPPLRRDQRLRVQPARPVRRQTPPTRRGLRPLARPALRSHRPDQPRRTRHRAQTQPGLAGTAERRR